MLKKPFLKSLHLNMVMQGSLVSKEYLVCGMGAVSDLSFIMWSWSIVPTVAARRSIPGRCLSGYSSDDMFG